MISNDADIKDLLNHLHIGIFRRMVGPKSRFAFVNSVLAEMLGYNAEELFQIPMANIFEDRKHLAEIEKILRRQGSLQNEEVRLVTRNKNLLWCSLSSNVVRDKSGKRKWIDGTIEDITQQKRLEKELAESKELFRTVFNNSAVAIVVADKDEKIMAWNPSFEEMLDMNKEDLFNKSVSELYPPREWQRVRSFRVTQQGTIPDMETQVYKKNGTILEVDLSTSLIKDLDGNITGYISIMRDITKQKLAERKIKESENKIRIILDNSPAAITLTDEQERIVSWNKYTEEILGKTKQELLMMPVSALYPPDEWKRIRGANIRKKGGQHHFETKVIGLQGKIIDVDLSVNVLKDSQNNVIGSVGIMQDITEQKKVQKMVLQAKQEAEKANSAKSLFLANMSHEVRTPMNTIMGMMDLTLETPLSDEQKENLQTAKDAADNLLSLLNDILDLSRVEAGKIILEYIELSIRNIVQSVVKGMSILAAKKNVELIWEVDPHVPEFVAGDPIRIRQILVNLINNAIKFTFKGKITTKIRLNFMNEHECELQFSVEDEGIGIPKDKQSNLFSVFTQVDESTTRRFGGTGLGLAICKRLVEMMGGGIWLESEEMKGSTFYFTAKFKLIKRRAEIPASAGERAGFSNTAPAKKLDRLSVLLAEDNVVNQKIAVKLLEKRGWQVKAVDNGQEVLDILDKENFDLILMDAQMPILDGLATTRMIRENERKTGKRIPIVALTARAMNDDKKKCLDVGMDGYVSKPIDINNLYETIEGIFKQGPPV